MALRERERESLRERESHGERVLHRLFGTLKAAQGTDQRRDDLAVLGAKDALYRRADLGLVVHVDASSHVPDGADLDRAAAIDAQCGGRGRWTQALTAAQLVGSDQLVGVRAPRLMALGLFGLGEVVQTIL